MPTEEELRKGMRRLPGARSGAFGVSYLYGGYYLSPDQFGYSTAQGATAGSAGGEMSTATGGDSGGGGGDGGGSA